MRVLRNLKYIIWVYVLYMCTRIISVTFAEVLIFYPHAVSLCCRPTNSHVREPPRSHTHPRGQEPGGGGYSHTREPSPEEEPCYMEQEEEQDYHTNYSPPPEQYSPPRQRGYHSDEYESLEPESSPPHPPPSHKDVRHAKSNRESSKKHHQSNQRRDRNEEPHQHSAKIGSDRGGGEGKKPSLESPAQKPSKQNKKSTTQERKVEEKKKKEEGKCTVYFRNDISSCKVWRWNL